MFKIVNFLLSATVVFLGIAGGAAPAATKVNKNMKAAGLKKVKNAKVGSIESVLPPKILPTAHSEASSSAAAMSASAATSPKDAPAGTSAVVLPAPPVKTGLGFVLMAKSESGLVNTQDEKNLDERQNGSFEGFVGPTYRFSKAHQIGYRHYYSGSFNGSRPTQGTDAQDGSEQQTVKPFTVTGRGLDALTYSYGSESGFLGSAPVTSIFYLFGPGQSEELLARGYRFGLRYDAQPTWQLSPKVSVSYFFSPRYAHFPENPVGNELISDSFKLIHVGEIDYSFSNNVVAYTTAGYTHVVGLRNNSEFKYLDETLNTAVGANFVVGNLVLNPEIAYDVKVKKNGGLKDDPQVLKGENLSLAVSGLLSF